MRKVISKLRSYKLKNLFSHTPESNALALLSRRKLERSEDLPKEYEAIIRVAAQTLKTERAGIWFFSEDRRRIHNTLLYKQSTDGFSSEPHFCSSDYPEYFKALDTGRAIDAADAQRDHRTREFRDAYLKPHKIMSMLDAPIRSRGAIIGIVCFESVGTRRQWTAIEQSFAASVADMIALTSSADENLRARGDLIHRATFESLVLGLAKGFLNATASDVDKTVHEGLKKIGEFSGMDCCYIYPFEAERTEMRVAYGWCRGSAPVKIGDRISCNLLPELTKRIRNLETVYLPDVASLPARADADRETLTTYGINSLVWVPLKQGDEAVGIVGFCSVSGKKTWTPESIQLLQVTADMFANLLNRTELETARAEALERERALEAKMQQLQTLESIGLLAAGTAHDFNNLLTAILGNTALALRLLPEGSPAVRYLTEVRSTAQRAGELTSQLLDCSGRRRPVRMSIDLNALISEVVEITRPLAPQGTSVLMDLAPGKLIIPGDAIQLRQVVLNLVKNALDSLVRDQKLITIRTGRVQCDANSLSSLLPGDNFKEGLFALIEISDTGNGIDRDALPRIFDPFFSTKSFGRGFGLASSMGIVRSHQGAIGVQSQPGIGSTFKVYLPRQVEQIKSRREDENTDLVVQLSRDSTKHPHGPGSSTVDADAAILELDELIDTVR